MTYGRKIHQRVTEKMKSCHSPFTSTLYESHFGSKGFILRYMKCQQVLNNKPMNGAGPPICRPGSVQLKL